MFQNAQAEDSSSEASYGKASVHLEASFHTFRNSPQVQKQFESFYSNISWVYFVEEIVLGDQFHKTEDQLEDIEGGGVWITHHWAPYWYTCGLCGTDLSPDFVLKTETLHLDIPAKLVSFQTSEVLG